MYYRLHISPRVKCAQWSELSIYYVHALKKCAFDALPSLNDLILSYSHFKDQGFKPMHPFTGKSSTFYILATAVMSVRRVHLYMYDHAVFEVEEGSKRHQLLEQFKGELLTMEQLKHPYIEHYEHVHNSLQANPKYGLTRVQYMSHPGKDGFKPNNLNFNLLFDGIAEIKELFNHQPIPSGQSQAQIEMGHRPHPDVIAKFKKNMYAERPDITFIKLYRNNPHTRYPRERMFEKDILKLHRRVRAYTDSDSVHHYVRELGYSCNSWDVRYWRDYFIKYTFAKKFSDLVDHLDRQLRRESRSRS